MLGTGARAATEWQLVEFAFRAGDQAIAAVAGTEAGGARLILACGETPGAMRVLLAGVTLDQGSAAPDTSLARYRIDGATPSASTIEAHTAPSFPDPLLRLTDLSDAWVGADLLELDVPTLGRRLQFDLAAGDRALKTLARNCGTDWPATRVAARRALVRDIQSALTAQGYDPGPRNGVYGPTTARAIAAYQRYHGRVADSAPSCGLLDELRGMPPSPLTAAKIESIASRIESHWRIPRGTEGVYDAIVPLRLTIDAGGAITAAHIEADAVDMRDPTLRRLAHAALDAAQATERIEGPSVGETGGRAEFVVHLRPPVKRSYRIYARKLAQRIELHAGLRATPLDPVPVHVRLNIDGGAQIIRPEILGGGEPDNAVVEAVLRFLRSIPRIPPVPVEGAPKLFIVDVTIFPRTGSVLAGRLAFPDWSIP